jgi:transcription elongation factor GreA
MKKFQFTEEGYAKIKQEYEELKHSKRQQAIDRLQKARAMGDLSENSEYVAAKEDLAFIEGRIRELEELMAHAEIVATQADGHTVDMGCKVIINVNGKDDEFTIVGEFEADPMAKKLSVTSPIGKALVGKKVGETVEVQVPAGKLKYKILDIKKS